MHPPGTPPGPENESSPLLGHKVHNSGHRQSGRSPPALITNEPPSERPYYGLSPPSSSAILRPNMVNRISSSTSINKSTGNTHTNHTHRPEEDHLPFASTPISQTPIIASPFTPTSPPPPPSSPATQPPVPLLVAPHAEPHTGNTNHDAILRDIIIGFSDGLTVPFALTAGLSSLGDTRIVIMGGLAELFSGMISMGLGAYLAAASERQHWEAEHAREAWEVDHCPAMERREIYDILAGYGIGSEAAGHVVRDLCKRENKKDWVRFMMDFELRLSEPDVDRAWVSAVTMGLSYFVGGLVPMVPYFFMSEAGAALLVSCAITVVILLAFGYLKSWVTIRTKRAGFWGALQTLIIGALAAGTSYAIVRGLDRSGGGS